MTIYKVGEDDVTHAILDRLISELAGSINLEMVRLPARGGKILQDLNKYNELSNQSPVILLTDLDNHNCPSNILNKITNKAPDFICRIAVKEAEEWLMADREGFSKFLGIPTTAMPNVRKIRPVRNPDDVELEISYKPSLYLMRELVPHSYKQHIIEGLTPLDGLSKGRLYNSILLPFIENQWDFQNAAKNSYSLKRSVERLNSFFRR